MLPILLQKLSFDWKLDHWHISEFGFQEEVANSLQSGHSSLGNQGEIVW